MPARQRAERPIHVPHLRGAPRPVPHVVVLVPVQLGHRAGDVVTTLVPAGPEQMEHRTKERVGVHRIAQAVRLQRREGVRGGECKVHVARPGQGVGGEHASQRPAPRFPGHHPHIRGRVCVRATVSGE